MLRKMMVIFFFVGSIISVSAQQSRMYFNMFVNDSFKNSKIVLENKEGDQIVCPLGVNSTTVMSCVETEFTGRFQAKLYNNGELNEQFKVNGHFPLFNIEPGNSYFFEKITLDMFKSPVKKKMLKFEQGKRLVLVQHRSFYRNPEAQVAFQIGKDGKKYSTSRFEFKEIAVLPGQQDLYLSARGLMSDLVLEKKDEWGEIIPNETIAVSDDTNSFIFYRLDINKNNTIEKALIPGTIY